MVRAWYNNDGTQISGSGLGSWTKEESVLLFSQIIPEMFQAAVERKIKIEQNK